MNRLLIYIMAAFITGSAHAQRLSTYTNLQKRDSILTSIVFSKSFKEEPQLLELFQPYFKGNVIVNEYRFSNEELNDDDSILFQIPNTKIGDIYYIVTLPCKNDWYDKILFKPHFVKMWILDTKEPIVINFGASEFTYRCTSE